MNVLIVVILASFAFVVVEQNHSENGLSLDSLCFVSEGLCHRNDESVQPKSMKDLDQYYCLSGPDFKKIVNKLQTVQDK